MNNTQEQEEENDSPIITPVGAQIGFLMDAKKHDLYKLGQKIDKEVLASLTLLVEMRDNTELDSKTRIECAKEIINKRIDLSKEINREVFQRMVAESRAAVLQLSNRSPAATKDVSDSSSKSKVSYKSDVIIDVSRATGV